MIEELAKAFIKFSVSESLLNIYTRVKNQILDIK